MLEDKDITITIEYCNQKGFDKPMPSPRPRFSRRGIGVITHMPDAYMAHKAYIRNQMPMLLIDSALSVEVKFFLPIPKSLSKKKQEQLNDNHHTTKPDIDNLLKTVFDAANGHIWTDDSKISRITSSKVYAYVPRVEINILVHDEQA